MLWLLLCLSATGFCANPNTSSPPPSCAPTPSDSLALVLDATERKENLLIGRGATPAELADLQARYIELERSHPGSVSVKNAFANFLFKIDANDQALQKWKESSALAPRNALILSRLGEASLAIGEPLQAERYFASATEAEPGNPDYHFRTANLLFLFRNDLEGDSDQALRLATNHFAEASRLAPEDCEYARAYAEVFYSVPNPDWELALAAWHHFRLISPQKDFAWANLARVYQNLGRPECGQYCLEEIRGPAFDRLKERLKRRATAGAP